MDYIQRSTFPDIKWIKTEFGEFPEYFSENAQRIVSQQYFRNGENSLWDIVSRVVNTITSNGKRLGHFSAPHSAERFAERLAGGLLGQRFSFNSPVWYNLGVNDEPQCSACFIQSVDDSMESIMQLATNEAMLFKHGSGTGTNLSSLRSSRETLSKSDGYASGPVSFMRMYDAVAGAIKSGGRTRRAAKMQILDEDHPDILAFIGAKAEEGRKAKALIAGGMTPAEAYGSVSLQNMNTSVRLSNAFMESLYNNGTVQLKSKSNLLRLGYERSDTIFSAIAKAAWECGDPGVQFSDTIEEDNMVPEYPIRASNPCSEFVFMDESACNLASMNVMKYMELDYSEFALDVQALIFAMDIIVSISSYPTQEIHDNSIVFRPLGLGLTNIGAYVMRLGYLYDSDEARKVAGNFAKDLMTEACRASALLAKTFGPYPGYGKREEDILRRKCGGDLPHDVTRYGVRNAQLTLMAPTGTISFMMDCESTGIEPVFAEVTTKTLAGGGTVRLEPECCIKFREINGTGIGPGMPDTAMGDRRVRPQGHLEMMAAVQPYLSGAISKTVNLPEEATVGDIEEVYLRAWELGLKCVAIFRDGCKGWQPMETKKDKPYEHIVGMAHPSHAPEFYTSTDSRRRMPETRSGVTHKFILGGVEGYLHVGEHADGTPGEIFVHVNKEGSTVGGLMDAWAICFSLALQYGVPLRKLVDKFRNTKFDPAGFTPNVDVPVATSLVDYVVRWLESRYLGSQRNEAAEKFTVELHYGAPVIRPIGEGCPRCGSLMTQTGTCKTCPSCGYGGGCG